MSIEENPISPFDEDNLPSHENPSVHIPKKAILDHYLGYFRTIKGSVASIRGTEGEIIEINSSDEDLTFELVDSDSPIIEIKESKTKKIVLYASLGALIASVGVAKVISNKRK